MLRFDRIMSAGGMSLAKMKGSVLSAAQNGPLAADIGGGQVDLHRARWFNIDSHAPGQDGKLGSIAELKFHVNHCYNVFYIRNGGLPFLYAIDLDRMQAAR